MNRLRTLVLTLALLWGFAAAAAPTLPPDAELIITEARGVIVGVGRVVDGTSFELALLAGFEGPARLTLLLRDGTTWTLEVVVSDATVRIDGVDLLELLPTSVEHVAVRFEPAAGAARGPAFGTPGARGEPPADPPAWGRPDEPPAGPRAPDVPGTPGGPPDDVPGGGNEEDEENEDEAPPPGRR